MHTRRILPLSHLRNAGAALALSLLVATGASAALSKQYEEWRNGPAQWIMTSDEQRAWRNVKTDQQAIDFIDLFWARRDPTPGTPDNEYRSDFETRVDVADRTYAEKNRRGSLTDRGRVFVVLGRPTRGAGEHSYTSSATNAAGAITGTSGSGRQMGARLEWEWGYEDARKFGMPKALVVFIQDPTSGRYTRDVQRTDFVTANAAAIKAALVNPDLKEIPGWALRGGLKPAALVVHTRPQPAQPAQNASSPAPAQGKVVGEFSVPFPAETASSGPRGASRLTLTSSDIYKVDTESKTDPFTTLRAVETFKASDELGWAAQYCTGSNDEPTLRFVVRITGTGTGEVVDRATEPDELVPDRIRVLSGCYMVRGSVPLEGMSPGSYTLQLILNDRETLSKAFRIE